MAKHKYITVSEFDFKYNLHRGHLWNMISSGSIPRSIIKDRADDVALVDENFFIRRLDFRAKIWNENHLMYFFLTKAMTQSAVARILAKVSGNSVPSWNNWMNCNMSVPLEFGICDYKIRDMHWKFNRIAKAVINKAFRLKHIAKDKRDLEVLILRD